MLGRANKHEDLPMKWRINYSDTTGAGDYDPADYDTLQQAQDEATERLASTDMPWAVEARLFPTDDDGEPLDAPDHVLIHR